MPVETDITRRSPEYFTTWLTEAKATDRALYYVGHLAADRAHQIEAPMGDEAWSAASIKLVHLIQRKREDGKGFDYLAVRARSRRRRTA